MLFGLFKKRRRASIIAEPFPEDWLPILEKNVAYYSLLTDAEKTKLKGDLRIFIAETSFEGCGGVEMSDEIKVTIAAQASILLLGYTDDYFEKVSTVLVYPTGFRSPNGWTAPDGVVHHEGYDMLGEAWKQGTVILAWDAVLDGGRDSHDGRNVVLHEFTHQIDYLDGFADGTPPMPDADHSNRWHHVLQTEYDRLVRESEHGHPKVLDSYGATNPAEFFAVATEAFFESSIQVQKRHPELYEVMKDFYRQDPAGRVKGQ